MCHEENDLKRQQKTAIIVKDAEDKIILMKKNQRCRRGIWQCRHFIVIEKKMWHGSMRQLKPVAVQNAPGSFAAWLSHQTDVYAWTMSGKRHDIGDRASYDAVQEIIKNQA